MQTFKLNGVEEGIQKVIESQGFAWQQNEMKQSQQQSPSFQQTFNRSQSQQDHNLKIDIQVGDMQIQLENNKREEARQENGEQQYKRQNKSLFQTLNNSIDKLFCNDNFSNGQDISKYVIFKDFQSDSKLNSKYGSKRESKQQTPKCTPRFNFQGQDCQILQQQVAQFFEKPNRNNSNYQSQESFCFKEGRNIESIIPNSQTYQPNINQVIFQNNLYNTYSQQNNGINNKVDNQNIGYSEYSPYMIYQKNNTNEIENQQQLNSYHLPQKKKKINTNGALNSTNIKQNSGFYHQLNSDYQDNINKQASMMIMMSQVQTHQKQYRLNKQQISKNNENQLSYNQNAGRVCQTEPSYDDFQEESEMLNSYKSGHINHDNGIKYYQQNEKDFGKSHFIKNENQSYYINNANNTKEYRNIQLTKRPINDTKNSKQITVEDRSYDYDKMKEDYFNEEELYDADQVRQNVIEDIVKFQQNNQQFANNLKHNNFLNQKLYQNQISRVKQQVMIQQQNTAKNIQKINGSDQKQSDFQNRSIKRNNTNPTGIAPTQQNPIRIGSGDSRKANQISMIKNTQLFGDQNKIFLNGKITTVNNNETTNFNHIQRKVRQFSAHANSSSSNQFQTDKNNHLIDEGYDANNESFINLNNIPLYTEGAQDEQGKQKGQKNVFIPQSQQNKNKQDIQNNVQQQNQIKKQLNFKSYQEDQISLNIEKQIINKKIQDFEKKRNLNLNSQQQPQQQQQQATSSSSQSSANSSKIANQQQNLMVNTPSSAQQQAVSQNSVYTVQQPKRNQSAQKKKKSKSKSPAQQKGLDSILEVSQKLEVSAFLNTQPIKQSQEKSKQLSNEQKKQSLGQEQNSTNSVDQASQSENQQETLKKGDIQQVDYGKVICKTEGNESDSSLKINFDESDANQLAKIEQDQQLLSTNQSSTYKITNQENALNYIRSVNSKQFQKNNKRIQSANKTSSTSNQNSFLMHPQLALTINNNQTLQNVPSNQYFLQTQSNMHRGRFNSYQNSNTNQLNLQQVQKKLNIQCQTTTNNGSSSQQNSLTNTLLKNQLKKRSFTPMATTNQQNLNQIQFQNSTFKDSFFNESQNQNGSRNNIKKITRNQKNFSMNNQQEKDQQNTAQQGILLQQIQSQYQYLQLNPQLQQASPQTFPNLQKQQIKRNEIAQSNNQLNIQTQQQNQQIPIQRPSSRSVLNQNNGAQQTAQKQKQILNLNPNIVGNTSSFNNNLNTNQVNLYNKVNKI